MNGGQEEPGAVYYIDGRHLVQRRIQTRIMRVDRQIRETRDNIVRARLAEEALVQVQELLEEMRECAVLAAEDGNPDREQLNRRVQELKLEIDKAIDGASYKGINLLRESGCLKPLEISG